MADDNKTNVLEQFAVDTLKGIRGRIKGLGWMMRLTFLMIVGIFGIDRLINTEDGNNVIMFYLGMHQKLRDLWNTFTAHFATFYKKVVKRYLIANIILFGVAVVAIIYEWYGIASAMLLLMAVAPFILSMVAEGFWARAGETGETAGFTNDVVRAILKPVKIISFGLFFYTILLLTLPAGTLSVQLSALIIATVMLASAYGSITGKESNIPYTICLTIALVLMVVHIVTISFKGAPATRGWIISAFHLREDKMKTSTMENELGGIEEGQEQLRIEGLQNQAENGIEQTIVPLAGADSTAVKDSTGNTIGWFVKGTDVFADYGRKRTIKGLEHVWTGKVLGGLTVLEGYAFIKDVGQLWTEGERRAWQKEQARLAGEEEEEPSYTSQTIRVTNTWKTTDIIPKPSEGFKLVPGDSLEVRLQGAESLVVEPIAGVGRISAGENPLRDLLEIRAIGGLTRRIEIRRY